MGTKGNTNYMQLALRYGKNALAWSVVVSTIAWSVGLAAILAPLSPVHGAMSGDLIRGSLPAVYYYGSDGKRYVFPNEKTYKTWYADFSGVKVITDSELASYPIGGNVTYRPGVKMVKITTDPKVYAVAENGALRWVTSEAVAVALYGANWNQMIDDVPDPFFVNYSTGADITDASQYNKANETAAATSINDDKNLGSATGGGSVTVSLASNTPATGNVIGKAARVPFTIVNFVNNTALDAIVDSVTVERAGLAQDAAFDSLDLLNGATNTPLNKTSKTLNSSHSAAFNDDFTVPANSSMSVVLAANMASSLASYAGELPILQLTAVVVKGGTVGGTLPIAGNYQVVNGTITVGDIDVTNGGNNPSASTQNVGIKDYIVSSIKLTNSSTQTNQHAVVKSITFTNNGSADAADIANLELVDSNTGEVLGTVAKPTGDKVTFNLSRQIDKGQNKTFDLRLDIEGGSARTISYDIEEKADVAVMDVLYGFNILPDYDNSGTPYYNAPNTTIGNGELRVESLSITPDQIAENLNQVTVGKFKLVAKGEAMNITAIGWQFVMTTSAAATAVADVSNVTIYDSANKVVAGPVSISATGSGAGSPDGTATTTDTITVPVGENTYTVKADLNSDFTANDTIQVRVNAGAITVKGDNTGNTITATPTDSNITSTLMTVKTARLDVRVGTTPAVQTIVAGVQALEVANIVLDATQSGDDIRVTNLPISVTHTGASFHNNLSSWKLWDGATQIAVSSETNSCDTSCSTAAARSTTTNVINSGVLKVNKGTSKTIKVTVNVGTGATSGSFSVGQTSGVSGIDSEGNSVSGTYADSGQAAKAGQAQTIAGAGTLNTSVLTSPQAGLVVGGSTADVGKFDVQAKNEGMNMTAFGFVIQAPDGGIVDPAATGRYDRQITSISLYDGATLLGSISINTTTATITPSSAVVIAINQTKNLTVKATFNTVGTGFPTLAGGGFAVLLSNIEASGTAAGSNPSSITKNGLGTAFKSFHVFKSLPTVSQITTTNSLIAGVNTLKQFKVTADSAGPIGLWKVTFGVSTSGVSFTQNGYYLYESDSQGGSGVLLAAGTSGITTADESVNYYGGDFRVETGAGDEAEVEAFFDVSNDNDVRRGEHLIINAGASKYFTFQGTLDADDTVDATLGNDSVSVTFRGDGSFGSTVSARAQTGFGGTTLTVNDKFIWSDLNLDQYSSTTATNSEMFFNGYRVPGLELTTSTPDIVTDQ
jgi:hypothetical protein